MTYRIQFELLGLPKTVCRVCGCEKVRVKSDLQPRGKYNYRDEVGNLWQGRRCNECSRLDKIRQSRARGHRAREDAVYKPISIGLRSELIAKAWLESRGFTVTHTSMFGPDLTIEKGGERKTVEVKTVSKVNGKQCWYVHEVLPTRQNDDFIAMVFENGKIIFEPMTHHLAQSSRTGKRVVTQYVQNHI